MAFRLTPNFAAPESELTYTLTYGNSGQAPATNVVIENALPPQLDPVEGSITNGGTYDRTTRRIAWRIATVGTGTRGEVGFRARIRRGVAVGTPIVNSATIQSFEQRDPQEAAATAVVGSPQISFDNTHTLFDEVNVTIRGLSLGTAPSRQGDSTSEPRVSLTFPVGTAISREVPAEAVTVSDDGTQVVARFHLLGTVLSSVAPTVRLQHPSVGKLTWRGPVLEVPEIDADLLYDKTFLRMGRWEPFTIQVRNQHSFPESCVVTLDIPLANVPAGENFVVQYRVVSPSGEEIAQGVYRQGGRSATFLLPPVRPFETANFTLLVRVAPERSRPTTRIEPVTTAIFIIVGGTAIVVAWAGARLLRSGCDSVIQHKLRSALADQDVDLSDAEIARLYEILRNANSLANQWLSLAQQGAEDEGLKSAIELALRRYLGSFPAHILADAVDIVRKVHRGELPYAVLLEWIADKLATAAGISNWATIPIKATFGVISSEAQQCMRGSSAAGGILERIRRRLIGPRGVSGESPSGVGGYPVTSSYDPNAKGGSLGFDGFVRGSDTLTYTVSFENLSTATAAAEEVLIEDVLQSELDLDSLTFTRFGVGNHQRMLPEGTQRLAEDVDLRPARNLIIQVRSRLDPVTRKLTVTFKGVEPTTGAHHPDGFLPPNVNPPEGEGYVTFQIRPKADAPSGTVIRNKANIIFDPHLGVNPPMETNEHVLTLDKQAPTVQVAAMPSQQPLPFFPVQWEGTDDASGIANAQIWFSEDGGPFQLFQVVEPSETRQVSGRATFKGRFGHQYRFYAVARDKVGNEQPHPDRPQATTRAGRPPTITAGLKMVTLPVISEITDPKTVFDFAENRWAWYDPTTREYVLYPAGSAFALQVGKGFWARFSQAVTPNVRGDLPDDTQPFTINLKGGSWNLIGNPWLFDLNWDVRAIHVRVNERTKALKDLQPQEGIEPYAWRWDGSRYQLIYDSSVLPGISDRLPAWEGAWVYAHQDATLILPAPTAMDHPRGRSRSEKPEGWVARLSATTGDGASEAIMGITTAQRLHIGEPPPPPEEQEDVKVFFLDRGGNLYKVDVRTGFHQRQEWDVVVKFRRTDDGTRGGEERQVIVTFDGIGYAPKDLNLWLVDQGTGKRLYMRTQSAYRFTPNPGETARQFTVIAEMGNTRPLQIIGLKASPMRGRSLAIQFGLTKPAQTWVEILTLTGRRVALLESGTSRLAGQHQVLWHGDGNGKRLAAGGYLVRVVATDEEGRQVQGVTIVRQLNH